MRNVILVALTLVLAVSSPALAAEWAELEPATSPSARIGHSLVTLADGVYLFGGDDATHHTLGDLWRWDRSGGTWELLASSTPAGARTYHSACAVGGKMLVAFGYGGNPVHDDLWLYDPELELWFAVTTYPALPGRGIGMMAALSDNQVFVAGGYGATGDALADAYVLSFGSMPKTAGAGVSVSASTLPGLPVALYGAGAAALDGRPAVIGGWAHAKQPVDDIYLYNSDTMTWETVSPSGEPVLGRTLAATATWRQSLKGTGWGDVVLIFGGETAEKANASATLQVWDSTANTWSYGPALPVALSSQAAAALPPAAGDRTVQFLMFGGMDVGQNRLGATYQLSSDVALVADQTIYLPAAAHGAGVGDTLWLTDVELHNRGGEAAVGTLALLVKDRPNPEPATVAVEVGAGQSERLADALTLFGFTGSAALRLEVAGGDVVVTSRTYNQGAAGTYGQFIPGVAAAGALAFGDEARLIQLARSADPATGFRSNVGFVNVGAGTADLEVELYAADGSQVGETLQVQLRGFEYRQLTDVYGLVGAGDVADGYAVVRTTTQGGRFFAYASVVDNATGDPIYVQPQRSMGEAGGCIAAAAHADGVGGTVWRTDLQLHNPGAATARARIFYLAKDQPNMAPIMATVRVDPGESLRYEDALPELLGVTGAGALTLEWQVGELMVTSRTYNLGPDGTYGQFIPLEQMGDATGFGEEARLIQLTDAESASEGFRSNIGLVNVTPAPLDVEVDLRSADGTLLGTWAATVREYEYKQLTDIQSVLGVGEVEDGFAVVRTTTQGGRFFTYASVVDNATGDPVFIPGM